MRGDRRERRREGDTGDQGTVSAELLRLALRYADRHRIDPAPTLRATGLDEVREGERVDGGLFAAFLRGLAETAGDPLLGIRFGAWAAGLPVSHLVLATALSAETAGEALDRLLAYHALLADVLAPTMVRHGAIAELRLGGCRDGSEGHHLAEAGVAMLARLVRRIGGGAGTVEVRLRRAAPAREVGSMLGAEVRFGAPVDAVRFPARALAARLPLADPELGEILERHAAGRLANLRRGTWTARVGKAVRVRSVRSGSAPTLGQIARALAVAPRTLQLRLREEATSFRRIVEEVRCARGEELLRDRTASLVEVAFLLGFRDQSAFTNAFRRWTGRTPAAYRRSMSPVRR